MPDHHPLPETMISFASGALPDAISAVVGSHLTMCRACAEDYRRLEIVGGLILDRTNAEDGDQALAANVLTQNLRRPPDAELARGPDDADAGKLLPRFLMRGLQITEAEITWEPLSSGIRRHNIRLPRRSGRLRLVRMARGQKLLQGGHFEIAIILQGRLRQDDREYRRGDIIQPSDYGAEPPTAAGAADCICLCAADAGTIGFGVPERSIITALRRKASSAQPPSMRGWQPAALAASLSLVIGVGLGSLIRDGSGASAITNLVQIDGNRLVAKGPLDGALNALPSGQEETASLDGEPLQFAVRMSFQNQIGDYCRQYQIGTSSHERYSGIACRENDSWVVQLHALASPAPSASQSTIPASSSANAAMDAVISAWMYGAPLVGRAEADVMRKGWREQ